MHLVKIYPDDKNPHLDYLCELNDEQFEEYNKITDHKKSI